MIKKKLHFFLLSLALISILGFVVLFPSFSLALQDDDWRGIVLPKTEYADGKLSTPYGLQLWFCAQLYDLIGFNFPYYYYLSFILRVFFAFCITIFIFYLTKNRLASILGGLMVVVTFSGLQTTYEIANTNVYIALIAFTVFLGAFSLNMKKLSIFNLFLLSGSLAFASIASPVRTYPLFIWIFIVDIAGLCLYFNKNRLKVFLLRQLVILLLFIFLYILGFFSWFSLAGNSESKIYDLGRFFTEIGGFLMNLNLKILFNYILGIGNIFLPGNLLNEYTSFALGIGYLISMLALISIVAKKKNENLFVFLSFYIWPLILYTGYFIVFLGGYEDSAKDTISIQSYRRYLLPPFIGFAICLSITLTINFRHWIKKLLPYFAIFLIVIHSAGSYLYLHNLSKQRDGAFMVKIWRQFKKLVPAEKLSSKDTKLFFFETDGSKRAIYTLDDGFILHAATLYKIPPKGKAASPDEILEFTKSLKHTFSIDQFISYLEKGFPNDTEPLTWDRIFALRIEGDQLYDVKYELKKKIGDMKAEK